MLVSRPGYFELEVLIEPDPESLSIVLNVYKQHVENGTNFTIRQAKWLSRLSSLKIKDTSIEKTGIPELIAKTEQLCDITGKSLDLRVFDKLLSGMESTGEEGTLTMAFSASASLAGILMNDPARVSKQSNVEPVIKKEKISPEEVLEFLKRKADAESKY